MTILRDAFVPGRSRNWHQGRPARARPGRDAQPYAKGGQYARFFSGRNTIDFSNDFVVIESEELKRKPDLQAVVNTSSRSTRSPARCTRRATAKKVWFIDGFKQQLGDRARTTWVMAVAIDEAARRACKYGGSLVAATQNGESDYHLAQMESARSAQTGPSSSPKPESIELFRPYGPFLDGRAEETALLNSLRMEPGVFSGVLHHLAHRRGIVAAHHPRPSLHLPSAQQAGRQRPAGCAPATGDCPSTTPSRTLRRRGMRQSCLPPIRPDPGVRDRRALARL